ncbi:hotdog fold thioesterase [Georgenia sp. TF02-10]|uniref:hotdog fold thioesterase n=1 Tax=Georgenia sp. TF02-10 TaxID=2917725 RepID=UPI001FA7CA9A|nr:hotdog fold thioesterase [Georgenia sp. TF02-10]UNX56162.1 hotdog fold thioesterase [Georgenia sp. TF02-10]
MTAHLLARLQAASVGTLSDRLGIELLEASAERVVARMPVAGNTQPFGLLHGGASVALAETVGSIAATLHAGTGRTAVGTEVNATHHRSVREGHVTATATPLHHGARTASYQVAVVDDDDRRVCTARLSCMLLDLPADGGRQDG